MFRPWPRILAHNFGDTHTTIVTVGYFGSFWYKGYFANLVAFISLSGPTIKEKRTVSSFLRSTLQYLMFGVKLEKL